MNLLNEIKRYFFINKESYSSKEEELYRGRFYAFIGVVITPLVILITHKYQVTHHLVFNSSFILVFLLILLGSYKINKVKENIHDFLYFNFIYIVVYNISNGYFNGFRYNEIFAIVCLIFVFSLVITTAQKLFFFLLSSLILFSFLLFTSDRLEIDPYYFVPFLTIFFIVSFIATNDKIRKQNKIKDSEVLLKRLFNETADSFLLVNAKTKKIIDCNKQFLKTILCDRKEVLGKRYDEFQKFKNSEEDNQFINSELNKKGVFYKNLVLINKNFEEILVDVAFNLITLKNIDFYFIRITDITERLQNEKKIISSEKKYRSLFNKNVAGVFRSTVEGEVIEINDAFAEIFGYSQHEIKEKGTNILYSSDVYRNNYINELKKQKTLSNKELLLKRKDQKEIWVLLNVAYIEEDGNEFVEGTLIDITDIKKTTEKLAKNERMLSEAQRIAKIGSWTLLHADNSITWSEEVYRMFGVDNTEKVNYDQFLSFIHPDDVEKVNNAYTKSIEEKTQYDVIHRIILKNGAIKHVHEKANTTFNEDGKPFISVGTVQDITEQVLINNKLKESEQRFRTLSNVAIEGVVLSKNEVILDVNDRFVQIHGYNSAAEVIGKKINDFVIPADYSLVQHRLKSTDNSFYIVKSRKKDGSEIYVETRGENIPYGDETIRASVVMDVTERILKESQLIESEERFKRLSEAAYEGIVIHDKGIILDANETFCTMFGYTVDELINTNGIDLAYGETKQLIIQKIETKDTLPFDGVMEKKNGQKIDVSIRGREIPYKGKTAVVASIRDISFEKEAIRKIKEGKEQFETVVEQVPAGIIIQQNDKIVYANPSAKKIFAIDDINRHSYFEFLTENEAKRIKERHKKISNNQEVQYEELEIIAKNGTKSRIESKPIKINFADQEATLIVIHDITERIKLHDEQIRLEVVEQTNIVLNKEIEERIKVEHALKDTEEFLNSIINSSLDIIIAADAESKITNFNKAAEFIFGYSEEEILGKPSSILYDKEEEELKVRKAIKGPEGKFVGEITNKTKYGETFTSFISAARLKNEKGEFVGSMGVSRDITNLKEAEEELRNSEEKYRDLFENSTDLIQSVDKEGIILFVNEAWKKTLGYKENEIIGKPIFSFLHEDNVEHCKYIFKNLKELTNQNIEIIFKTSKGKKIIAEGNISTKQENGKVIATRGIFRDVTQSKDIQRQIIEKQSHLEGLINNTTDMILSIDRDFNIIECNNVYKQMIKRVYGTDDLIGKYVLDYVYDKNHKKEFLAIYKRVFKTGKPHFEVFHQQADNNHEFYFETYYNPIQDSLSKQVIAIAIFSRDITERVQTEEFIKKGLKEKEILLAEIHHRVKNNLQVISSILNLQSSYVSDEGTLDILKESQNRVKTMALIHESLYQTKDFSKINFTDYIKNLSGNLLYSYQIYDNLVEIKLDLDDIYIHLDQSIPAGLIVNELVTNSLKYAFPEKRSGVVDLKIKEKEGYLSIIVADNGVGMAKDINFENTDSLGLQLVYTLTEQLDGKINYKTEKNKGTKFEIKFKKQ